MHSLGSLVSQFEIERIGVFKISHGHRMENQELERIPMALKVDLRDWLKEYERNYEKDSGLTRQCIRTHLVGWSSSMLSFQLADFFCVECSLLLS